MLFYVHFSQPYINEIIDLTPSDLTDEVSTKYSYIKDELATYLEARNAKLIPILFDAPWEVLEKTLSKLDGVAFTGGPLWTNQTIDTPFVARARQIYEYSLIREPKLPLLGVCQGFQMISMFAAESKDILVKHVADFKFHPIRFTDLHAIPHPQSRILSAMPENIRKTFQMKQTATNVHHFGISLTNFTSTPYSDKFNLVALDYDDNDDLIVGMVEHKSHPILASQFHPEVDPSVFMFSSLKTQKDDEVTNALNWLGSYFISLTETARIERVAKNVGWDWSEENLALVDFTHPENKNWLYYSNYNSTLDWINRFAGFPRWEDLSEGTKQALTPIDGGDNFSINSELKRI